MKTKYFNKILLVAALTALLAGCDIQKPTEVDGTMGNYRLVIIDSTRTLPVDELTGVALIPGAKVRLYSKEYDKTLEYITDETGMVEVDNVLASTFQISVDRIVPAAFWLALGGVGKDVMFTGGKDLSIFTSEPMRVDTIKCTRILLSGLVINEIYYCGPPASGTYYYDQFVELYNASMDTMYLDGLIISRASQAPLFLDQYAEAIYSYQFPGDGDDHPIFPGQFVVIAEDAMDHVKEGGAAGSLDLSGADWEFFTEMNIDLDNPNVPNLNNVNPNKTVDFLINFSHNAVFLVKVADITQVPFNAKDYHLFNFDDIVDAVEYAGNPEVTKEISTQLDAGLAGRRITKYSGKSTEREHPETGAPGYDSNNSTFDFVSLSRPTPGRQHRPDEIMPEE
jgi:hypothetical protein